MKKSVKSPFSKRISVKITVAFMLAFIVAILVLVLITSSLFEDRLSEEVGLVVGQKLSLAGLRLDSTISEIKSLHFSLEHNQKLQAIMKRQIEGSKITLEDSNELREEIAKVLDRIDSSIRSIIFIDTEGEILDPIYSDKQYSDALINNLEFSNFEFSQLTGRFSTPSGFPYSINPQMYSTWGTVTYYGDYYDTFSYKSLGSVAINCKSSYLLSEALQILKSTFTHAYILDENSNIILQTGELKEPPSKIAALNQGRVSLGDSSYSVYKHRLASYPNWTIIGLVSYETIMQPAKSLMPAILAASILLLFMLGVISAKISGHITRPLLELNVEMQDLSKGEWKEAHIDTTSCEIDELVQGYNLMVKSLQKLTLQITDAQIQERKTKVAMIQSQLDLLQSQINPHFIHNTLNTMRYMAQKENAFELEELIVSFNALLRTSMSQSTVNTSLAEEVENLRHYMNIQLKRYDVELAFKIDVSETAAKVMLPKLLLQPLIENSLFHGILPNGSGSIVLTAAVANGRLWVQVRDDGAGMDVDALNEIMGGNLPNPRGYNQIGLANVNDRLCLFYSKASALVIESMLGVGTSIGFSIPTNIKEDANEAVNC